MDYENDEDSSDGMDSNNCQEVSTCTSYSGSYSSRKTDVKNDSNILPLRKSIMVGSSYQSSIPELSRKAPYSDKKKPYSCEDKLVWNPYKISEDDVQKYLVTVQRINFEKLHGVTALPRGSHTRDDEQYLYLLHQCNYNTDKALQKVKSSISSCTSSSNWSEDDCKNFESGIRIYGKDFFLIRNNKLKTRSVSELVQFYYLWKKTERHDVFANRVKLEKKKYSLHPGVTFIDEHEDGSFPNIQYLIYGDVKKFHRGTVLVNPTAHDNVSSDSSKYNNKINVNINSDNTPS